MTNISPSISLTALIPFSECNSTAKKNPNPQIICKTNTYIKKRGDDNSKKITSQNRLKRRLKWSRNGCGRHLRATRSARNLDSTQFRHRKAQLRTQYRGSLEQWLACSYVVAVTWTQRKSPHCSSNSSCHSCKIPFFRHSKIPYLILLEKLLDNIALLLPLFSPFCRITFWGNGFFPPLLLLPV